MCIWKTNPHSHGDHPVNSRGNQGLYSLKTLLVLSWERSGSDLQMEFPSVGIFYPVSFGSSTKIVAFSGPSAPCRCVIDNSTTWVLELESGGLGFWELRLLGAVVSFKGSDALLCVTRGENPAWIYGGKRVKFAFEGVFSQMRSHCEVGGTETQQHKVFNKVSQISWHVQGFNKTLSRKSRLFKEPGWGETLFELLWLDFSVFSYNSG